jgi:hypothetical protein
MSDERDEAVAWWREPVMWLVVGGPAAVVVASLVTAGIALQRPDPVITVEQAKPPAMQARNHAATPPQAQR